MIFTSYVVCLKVCRNVQLLNLNTHVKLIFSLTRVLWLNENIVNKNHKFKPTNVRAQIKMLANLYKTPDLGDVDFSSSIQECKSSSIQNV